MARTGIAIVVSEAFVLLCAVIVSELKHGNTLCVQLALWGGMKRQMRCEGNPGGRKRFSPTAGVSVALETERAKKGQSGTELKTTTFSGWEREGGGGKGQFSRPLVLACFLLTLMNSIASGVDESGRSSGASAALHKKYSEKSPFSGG